MFFITLFLIRQIFRDFSFVEANCKAIFKLTDDLTPPPPPREGGHAFWVTSKMVTGIAHPVIFLSLASHACIPVSKPAFPVWGLQRNSIVSPFSM